MGNKSFKAAMEVEESAKEVFESINNVRGWWSENIEGRTDKANSEFTYRDKYMTAKMKISHFTPQKIVWDVVESHNVFFRNHSEWDNTQIVFEITERPGKTEIKFTHAGLVPEIECYPVCSNSWEFFITDSLKSLIETGKGKDISNDNDSFTTSITVDKSPEEVFKAVNNARG